MRKIAIVTLIGWNNYGNRLQNYAVQKCYEKFGYKCETLIFTHHAILKRLQIFIKMYTGKFLKRNDPQAYRFYVFQKFNKKYLQIKVIQYNHGISLKKINHYKWFSVGSDQVWNTNWLSAEELDIFLLSFVAPEKRICLAPSFGIEKISNDRKSVFLRELRKFSHLSCRERVGVQIINSLLHKTPQLLIDPTLMLDQKDWNLLLNKPSNLPVKKSYIFLYYLGDITEEMKNIIKKIADENELVVISLSDKANSKTKKYGPGDFLYLISHAALICTDSFHAMVFSFLYDRPFLVFKRAGKESGMLSRIECFLDMFELRSRLVDGNVDFNCFYCDYTEGKKILALERMKFFLYMKDIFSC